MTGSEISTKVGDALSGKAGEACCCSQPATCCRQEYDPFLDVPWGGSRVNDHRQFELHRGLWV